MDCAVNEIFSHIKDVNLVILKKYKRSNNDFHDKQSVKGSPIVIKKRNYHKEKI